MNEPIYEYEKGKGWIPRNPSFGHIVTLKGGTKVRLENRKPEIGEWYSWAGEGDISWVNDDLTPRMDQWVSHYQGESEQFMLTFTSAAERRHQSENRCWMTFVRL